MTDFEVRPLAEMGTESMLLARMGRKGSFPPARIYLTGRLAIETRHGVFDERLLPSRQARVIFGMLVLERSRTVSREELAEVLWPERLPRTWGPALRGVVSKVRAFVGRTGLSNGLARSGCSGRYQLDLSHDVVVDVESACSMVETAEQMLREGNPVRAIELAEHARVIVRRRFIPDATGRWIDEVRAQLDEALVWALNILGEAYAQRGQYQHAVRVAENAIALQPFREQTHRLLMRSHAAAGNPAEALRAFNRCRQLLANELGVDPAAETADLHVALLRCYNSPGASAVPRC